MLNYPPQMSVYPYKMLRCQSRDVCLDSAPKCELTVRSCLSFEKGMNYPAQRHHEHHGALAGIGYVPRAHYSDCPEWSLVHSALWRSCSS